MMIASSAMTAASGVQQYQGNRAMGRHAMQSAQREKQLSDLAAADALERGAHEQADARRKLNAFRGGQRTGLASSGFDANAGSLLDVVEDTNVLGENDILNIKFNAEREAWAARTQGQTALAQGQMDRAGYNSKATSSLLSSASQVAGSWTRYKTGYGYDPYGPYGYDPYGPYGYGYDGRAGKPRNTPWSNGSGEK
jgi:hypothetical protein